MAIAFGFLMGFITIFGIMKIYQLEQKNKELLNEIAKSKSKEIEKVEETKKEEKNEDNKEEEEVKEEKNEMKEEIKEENAKEEEKKNEVKGKKNNNKKEKLVEVKQIIKGDPEFKRPESVEPKVDEGEWSVVGKKKKKVKKE